MSQDWSSDTYEPTNTFSIDLQHIEDNFATLKSNWSGLAQPSDRQAGQFWFDTSNKILKIRSFTNFSWLGAMYGNTSFKIWMYWNSAPDGWAQDASITDRVLAFKKTSTGGEIGGGWYISGNSLNTTGSSHNHQLYDHPSSSWNTDGSTPKAWIKIAGGSDRKTVQHTGSGNLFTVTEDLWTEITTHSHSIAGDGDWRPAAAVGIMVYPNI
jgi:hypothetical protein